MKTLYTFSWYAFENTVKYLASLAVFPNTFRSQTLEIWFGELKKYIRDNTTNYPKKRPFRARDPGNLVNSGHFLILLVGNRRRLGDKYILNIRTLKKVSVQFLGFEERILRPIFEIKFQILNRVGPSVVFLRTEHSFNFIFLVDCYSIMVK
jgi:hypothetical protein